ncbi:MAG: helix-turn-helix domain-containing protein, partial [Nanoarchaeota archaeon]
MQECFRCHVSDEKERLVDAIFQDKIVKSCESCVHISGLTTIRRPTTYQLKNAEKITSVYERLARSRGLEIKSHSKEEIEEKERIEREVRKQNITLKDLIDKKLKTEREKNEGQKKVENKIPVLKLIENFHWHIMRARRAKKITQEQLARDLGESVAVIKMIEQGKLPEDEYILIPKIENYFKIKLKTDSSYAEFSEGLIEHDY